MNGLITSPSMSNTFSTVLLGTSPSRNRIYISKAMLNDDKHHLRNHTYATSATNAMVAKNSTASEYDMVCRKLLSFSELETDWDGYDGVPASFPMTVFAMNLISEINNSFLLPKVTLASNGNISFYWKNVHDKSYIEIELDTIGTYNYLIKKNGDVSGEEDVHYETLGLTKGLVSGLSSYLKYPHYSSAA